MSDPLIPQEGAETIDEGNDVEEGLSNQPVNDPND